MHAAILVALAAGAGAFAPAPAVSHRAAPLSAEALKIGIVGGGTVGGGIVEILTRKQEQLTACAGGVGMEVKTVVVRDKSKERDWALPPGCTVTEDVDDVLDDADIDLVVEVAGGTTFAKDVVFGALKKRKDVVTANKALIAACLPEIEALLEDVNAERATRWRPRGVSYTDCLTEASALGYAEADPTLDVGGFDARSKLAIMIRLAFGVDVSEDDISCKGITNIKQVDFAYAKELLGGTIKLLGVAEMAAEGHELTAYVTPAFVPDGNTLAVIDDAINAVEITSENLQSSLLVGRGAGRFPTANSCVSDIVGCARKGLPEAFAKKTTDVTFMNDFSSQFYLRIQYRNEVGIVGNLGDICAKHDVSIYSLLQKPESDYFVLITEYGPRSNIKKVAAEVEGASWCVGDTFLMPVATKE
ncbi:homoserine dehydrogenase [Aureococcus anophagefferens]|nr:homoserine dehydrogenase [Aureococcus anophagefferens]